MPCTVCPLVRLSVCPALITTVQPTIFNGSCSYLVQLLALVRAWTLLTMVSLCSFHRANNLLLELGRPRVSVLWMVFSMMGLTYWRRVTHICVGNLTNIDSDNGLSPDRRQAIIWTNAGLLLIGPLGTNFNEILIEILTFSFKSVVCKTAAILSRP